MKRTRLKLRVVKLQFWNKNNDEKTKKKIINNEKIQ